jgi:hypothetical protein
VRPARRGFVLVTISSVSFGGVAVLSKLALDAGMSVLALQFWRWGIAGPMAFRRRVTRGLSGLRAIGLIFPVPVPE